MRTPIILAAPITELRLSSLKTMWQSTADSQRRREWASRDPNIYQTILSGDIGVVDNNSDNSYHVVTGSDTNSTAILDGFTITAGNANGSFPVQFTAVGCMISVTAAHT